MSLCNNCYHNKVCEYQSCYKENCSHYKNENLIYELPCVIYYLEVRKRKMSENERRNLF